MPMFTIAIQRVENRTGRPRASALAWLSCLIGIATFALPVGTRSAVVEFFNPDLNSYFITADPVEQDMVDTGAVGRWQRTGNAFATGGPIPVCRFYGSVSPGPNSHFYTAEAAECAELKRLQAITPVSAPRWNFESNDFLTTPAVNRRCPAGLVPIYRAYNNGSARGIDSNHRITSDYGAYLQTVAAGSTGEGVVMCAPPGNPPATPTAVGVPTASVTSATIGAAGGRVASPDGQMAVSIPAGALATDTVIGIQPLTNLAHSKIGAAYRLTPNGQTFLHPVTLTFAYTDEDLKGTAADFLGVAFQTDTGYWQWVGDATVDKTARTLSVAVSHFTDFSAAKGVQIRPASATVRVNGTVALQIRDCYNPQPDEEPAPLPTLRGFDCDAPQTQVAALSVYGWLASRGTIRGSGATATYTAPATKPADPVGVTATVYSRKTRGYAALFASITVTDQASPYTGTINFSLSGVGTTHGVANVTWTPFEDLGDTRRYVPSGTITADFQPADCDPLHATVPIYATAPGGPGPTMVVYTASNAAFANKHQFGMSAAPGTFLTLSCGNPRHAVQVPAAGLTAFVVGGCTAPDFQPFTDEAHLTGTYSCGISRLNASWDFIAQ
jgi:hypothetical protein